MAYCPLRQIDLPAGARQLRDSWLADLGARLATPGADWNVITRETLFELAYPGQGSWAERHDTHGYLEFVRAFYAGLEVHPGSCPMGSSGFVVDADATVYPCFHRRDLPAGNLLRDPWPRIEGQLLRAADGLQAARCFGEHCISLFVGIRPTLPAREITLQ